MKSFHICTFVTDRTQYQQMKDSFIAAGFDEQRCRYTVFDNAANNVYEPYSTIPRVLQETIEPYTIFCHQDVLLNQGDGFKQLLRALKELDQIDPRWAVAGNAGINSRYQSVRRITDPHNRSQWSGELPAKVHSLDENFLVIKTSAKVKCSAELAGFHLYAIDLCLNAIFNGYSAYVIDFHLTHLSHGKWSQAFIDSQKNFQNVWSRRFLFCYVSSPAMTVFLSRNALIRRIFSSPRVERRFMKALASFYAISARVKAGIRQSKHRTKQGIAIMKKRMQPSFPLPHLL